MALSKQVIDTPAADAATAVKPVGKFEPMDETVAATPAANESAAPTGPAVNAPDAPTASSPAPQSAVVAAAAPAGAVAVSNRAAGSAFQQEVQAMKGAGDFSYGNYEVFKGINGSIKGTTGDKVSLGRWVKVSMVGWDDRIQISPGADTDEAKDTVAYSKDGITVDSVIGKERYGAWIGKKVADYLSFLKSNDYSKADSSRYIDVACIVHTGESAAAKALAGEVICVSLSKSSIPSFSSYQEKLNMKAAAVARGIPGVKLPEDPFTFYFSTEAASANGKDWTKLKVSDKMPVFD